MPEPRPSARALQEHLAEHARLQGKEPIPRADRAVARADENTKEAREPAELREGRPKPPTP